MKQRNIRKKRALEEEEEPASGGEQPEQQQAASLEDIKLLQKQRKRAVGVSAAALAASRAEGADLDEGNNELMEAYVKAQGGAAVLSEEQHMERFVELEVARRLGKAVADTDGSRSAREREEAALYEVPAELKAQLKNEVSIPGMNTAITEVDIGLEAKMKKIEETEAAKRRLLERDAWADEPLGPAEEARLPRAAFVPRFGKQPKKVEPPPGVDADEWERQQKFVSERTGDPYKQAQRHKAKGLP